MSDTKELILQRLLSHIPDEYDKSVGSFFYDTQMPLAIEHETIYKQLNAILGQGFAATARGEYLEMKAAEQGMARKPATFAEGAVRITGTPDAAVPLGCKASSDLSVYSVLSEAVISESGAVDVPIRCDTAGAIGNVPVGAVKDFPVSVPGLSAVMNLENITGGYNAETDGELRQRYFDKVSSPATSGNKQHYINWAKEIPGVGDVRVLPLWNGNGTVKVIIVNAGNAPAEPALIEKATAHIEEKRPVGASVTVTTATAVNIDVSIKHVIAAGFSTEIIKPKIEAAINAYLKRIVFLSNYVSIAHIGSAILTVDGVYDFSDLTVNGGFLNVPINSEQVAVLGELIIKN
jgi:uncharacterized phage protein gp47/JayE